VSEASLGYPFVGAPGVVAGQVDVFPSEWRDVLEQSGVDNLRLSKSFDSTFQIDGIPERDGGCDQIEPAGTMTLVLEGPISYLAQAVEEDGAGE
jgi:hypothetical protein